MVNELTVLASIHVLAAVFWVGGGFALNVAMALAGRQADPGPRLAAFRLADLLGLWVFPLLSLIVIATGVWMTEEYYAWDQLWIVLGLIGAVSAITIGLFYIRPRAVRAAAGIAAGAAPPPGRNWVPTVARLNLLLLSAIVVIMVIKPT
ncbi:MAG: DUF2269 family protein [Solirubrobacterales bacterium]